MNPLIGHADVVARFLGAQDSGTMHHAWLLHGVSGIGKSLLARHMATAYLCEANRQSRAAQTACGECHGCRMIEANSHPDLFQMGLAEKKRDISVQQARDLLDFLSLSGAESHRRVAVIDDAETLNRQAANALLKGVEEPGSSLLLILVCSDMQRLPATLRSRCLLQPCYPLADADCLKVLETLDLPDSCRQLAVRLAQGRPGRVACMANAELGDAIATWLDISADMAAADVGDIDAWISRNISKAPHSLIADVVLHHLSPQLADPAGPFEMLDDLHQAASRIAMWPESVRRHTLRPGQSLLAHLVGLRLALRRVNKAA
ncbi:MAG: DNA polymerase III subunit delta' [Mariprofundaceae bacterium]